MKTLQNRFKDIICILAVAAAFLAASCSKNTNAPETSTAKLEDIDGAMLYVSMQHPKLICQSLDKFITAIPEASYGRMLLQTYGSQFGYPEFAEIGANTNIGLVMPNATLEQLRRGKTTPVIFIKLKENGKIWNALAKQGRMKTKKQGDWTMFAETDAAIAAIKNPDAIIAKLSAPQAENLRVWARLNGETANAYKTLITETISHALTQSTLPDAEKTAFNAYSTILLGELFDSLHSGHATLNLGDDSLRITAGSQFKPDTPIGTWLSSTNDTAPTVGKYIASDALLSACMHFSPKAGKELTNHMIDQLLKVDYPAFSKPLAQYKQDSANYWDKMDGCAALVMNMDFDFDNLTAPKGTAETFVAYSGNFDQQSMKTMQSAMNLIQEILAQITKLARQNSTSPIPEISISNEPNSLTVEGCAFDAMTMTFNNTNANMPPQKTYTGVAGGNMISASSETVLQKRLPGVLAKKTLADNVFVANPLAPHDFISMSINGSAIVDIACKASKIDLADPDRQALFASVKDAYKKSAPVRLTLENNQADITYKIDVPYKFIATSMQLGQNVSAAKQGDN